MENKTYQRDFFKKDPFEHRLSILIGQRGTGKTTLIIQYLLKTVKDDPLNTSILYIPADHFLLRSLSLYEIAEQFVQLGGKIIAFDEIHQYVEWSKELKSIYDTFPALKIIASGSSALEIQKGSHDLTRRAIIYSLEGLSFREYLELQLHITLPSISLQDLLSDHEKFSLETIRKIEKEKRKILPLFKEYLQTGYYPYFLEINNASLYFVTLEQNLHTVIESDLTAIYPALTGNSTKKIKQLLSFIAMTVPFTPNWKKIKELVEVGDERTLKTYFKYLEDVGLIRTVIKYSKKMRQFETPEKIYLNNSNQLYAISSQASNIGTVRETFFLSMTAPFHKAAIPVSGDFILDGRFIFEIGGKNKTFEQIKDEKNAYLVCDNLEQGIKNKIPVWLFGFLAFCISGT
ncbi:MAG: AAA family ATPase [Pseudomonadota bacterium]